MKEKLGAFFAAIFVGLFYLLGIWGEFGGIYHAFKSHGTTDGLIAIFVPPYSWYRAIEFFWHNDFRGVDWDKRIQADSRIIVSLINEASDKDSDKQKVEREIESIAKELSKYPKERKSQLRLIADEYVDYSIALYEDLMKSIEEGVINKMFQFSKTERTRQLEDKLIKFGLDEFISSQNKAFTALFDSEETKKNLTEKYNEKTLPELRSYSKSAREIIVNEMNSTIRKIFE